MENTSRIINLAAALDVAAGNTRLMIEQRTGKDKDGKTVERESLCLDIPDNDLILSNEDIQVLLPFIFDAFRNGWRDYVTSAVKDEKWVRAEIIPESAHATFSSKSNVIAWLNERALAEVKRGKRASMITAAKIADWLGNDGLALESLKTRICAKQGWNPAAMQTSQIAAFGKLLEVNIRAVSVLAKRSAAISDIELAEKVLSVIPDCEMKTALLEKASQLKNPAATAESDLGF